MTPRPGEPGSQLSFAKVAAMHSRAEPEQSGTPGQSNADFTAQDAERSGTLQPAPSEGARDSIVESLDSLHLRPDIEQRPTLEASGDVQDDGRPRPDCLFDDDQTHLSTSSTKPTSFDAKSMASVTTFAMDEKESLRPDDSASVQAVEEDEYFTPAGDTLDPQINSNPSASNKDSLSREPDLFKEGVVQANVDFPGAEMPADENQRNLHGFPSEPDEKLIEALSSPKDRLLLLQLEDKIITFIKSSSEGSLELPPCNSFGRLLAHKLGDYYHLTHFVDNNVTSVRLHRTPWSRLPTPLTMLPPAHPQTPPPSAPTMKIMRRLGQPGDKNSVGGSTAPSSAVPSKTASESGADGANDENGGTSSAGATPSKDRANLTREEREAKYQEARERIFRDFPETKVAEGSGSGEHSTDISRSSSRTGRKKASKPKSPNDDGFEARSQFNAYYATGSLSGGPAVYHNIPHNAGVSSQNYYVVPQSSANPTAHYMPINHAGPICPAPGSVNGMYTYPGAQQHPSQAGWQGGQTPKFTGYTQYQQHPTQLSPMITQRSPTIPSPRIASYSSPNPPQYSQPTPVWTPPSYQSGYSQPITRPSPVHWPAVPPNAMPGGQNPYTQGIGPQQSFMHNKSPHPAPGSFSRSRFSPQSRSFAPASSSQATYLDHNSQPTHFPNNQYSNNNNFPRQGFLRDTLRPGLNPAAPTQHYKSQGPLSNPLSQQPAYGRQVDSADSSIAKWGTPSHLPPKPPPPEASYHHDTMARIPSVTSPPASNTAPSDAKPAPFVVSGSTANEKAQPSHTLPMD